MPISLIPNGRASEEQAVLSANDKRSHARINFCLLPGGQANRKHVNGYLEVRKSIQLAGFRLWSRSQRLRSKFPGPLLLSVGVVEGS